MTESWVGVPEGSPFPVHNLPFGVFSVGGGHPRAGVAVGEGILDVAPLLDDADLAEPTLNRFLARGPGRWREVRSRLRDVLDRARPPAGADRHVIPASSATLHLPIDVADYVDFYSSRHHAENAGRIFRPGGDPLPASWLHLPIGYHGRAGTVVVSGTSIPRPWGPRPAQPGGRPELGPSRAVDFEAEVGFVVGWPSEPGSPVPPGHFAEHVFGVVLVNDWSARDIQAWEASPLGPLLGKSFATSISPWIVPLDALEAARLPAPAQDPPPLPYLVDDDGWGLDLTLEVSLNGEVVARPPFAAMYWTPAQQLAHLTANGARLRTGDLLASGTVSGSERPQWGSLLELTSNGCDRLDLGDGTTRTYLEDGDTVTITATAPGGPGPIGLGSVTGTVCASE